MDTHVPVEDWDAARNYTPEEIAMSRRLAVPPPPRPPTRAYRFRRWLAERIAPEQVVFLSRGAFENYIPGANIPMLD